MRSTNGERLQDRFTWWTPEFQSLPVLNKHKMEGTAGTTGTVSPVRSSCRNSAEDEGMLPGNRAGDWGTLQDMAKELNSFESSEGLFAMELQGINYTLPDFHPNK